MLFWNGQNGLDSVSDFIFTSRACELALGVFGDGFSPAPVSGRGAPLQTCQEPGVGTRWDLRQKRAEQFSELGDGDVGHGVVSCVEPRP